VEAGAVFREREKAFAHVVVGVLTERTFRTRRG